MKRCPCGVEYEGDIRTEKALCRACKGSLGARATVGLREVLGSKNPSWKGGHKYWQAGKLGRDKDGLSWKVQRELCRQRDRNTCQDCGKHKDELGAEPDCDHEVPYRISFSHALSNLKLRCRSCHKKAEASRPELWGGSSFGGGPRPRLYKPPVCNRCSKVRVLEKDDLCHNCLLEVKIIPRAKELRLIGMKQADIAEVLSTSQQLVSVWLRL